jgi:hypothetical protein
MNNKLDIELFFNLKYHENCLHLDNDIIESIVDTFTNNKKSKPVQKKTMAIIRNPKLKQMKDKISNKVNLILNKLSENNIDNLVIEFIENIKINNIDDYNEFIKLFYLKLLSEIGFFKFYIKFFFILTSIYEKVHNYNIEYFYNLIESKFTYDYFDNINTETEYFKDMNDDKRINNLILLRELIKVNYFNESFTEYINDKILNQKKYLSDIYYWFKDNILTNTDIKNIKLILNDEIQLRDKVLLDNLLSGCNNIDINQPCNKIIFKKTSTENKLSFSEVVTIEKKIIQEKVIQEKIIQETNNLSTELDNYLEEYFFIDNLESIKDYIDNNCQDANTKNKFCEYIIDKYFKLQNNDSLKILTLMKKLVKLKILFKSNLSRGLLNLYNNKIFYNQDKFKKLLLFLKSLGITNGLENLMSKYKIEFSINL